MADTKPAETSPPAAPVAATTKAGEAPVTHEVIKTGAKAPETVTAPEPQSPIAKKIQSDKEAKINRIHTVLERLSNSQLDSVYQYANTQAEGPARPK